MPKTEAMLAGSLGQNPRSVPGDAGSATKLGYNVSCRLSPRSRLFGNFGRSNKWLGDLLGFLIGGDDAAIPSEFVAKVSRPSVRRLDGVVARGGGPGGAVGADRRSAEFLWRAARCHAAFCGPGTQRPLPKTGAGCPEHL